MSETRKGKTFSEEHKRKISEAKKIHQKKPEEKWDMQVQVEDGGMMVAEIQNLWWNILVMIGNLEGNEKTYQIFIVTFQRPLL